MVTKTSHLPIRYFLTLLWAHPILHISTIRVNFLVRVILMCLSFPGFLNLQLCQGTYRIFFCCECTLDTANKTWTYTLSEKLHPNSAMKYTYSLNYSLILLSAWCHRGLFLGSLSFRDDSANRKNILKQFYEIKITRIQLRVHKSWALPTVLTRVSAEHNVSLTLSYSRPSGRSVYVISLASPLTQIGKNSFRHRNVSKLVVFPIS